MRSLFFLVAMPFLFDAGVAALLDHCGPAAAPPPRIEARHGFVVLQDWDGAERIAAARDVAQGSARIAVLGEF